MSTALNSRSLKNLQGVHPHLVALVKRAAEISKVPFQITEGVRTLKRQKEMIAKGASQTEKSRHIPAANGLCHAVDVVAYIGDRVSWEMPLYAAIADAFKQAAREMGRRVTWGGDWETIKDGPHFELPWDDYPGIGSVEDIPAAQPTESDKRILAIGAAGSKVQLLQKLLNENGATLIIDGDFGSSTRKAVIAFQQSKALKADGIVGPNTWKALGNG